jgi:tol-pal system protein YbgF
MKLSGLFLSLSLAGILSGCASSQLTKIDSDIAKTQEMIQTTRSESKADSDQFQKEISSISVEIQQLKQSQSSLQKSLADLNASLKVLSTSVTKLGDRFQANDPNVAGTMPALPGDFTLPGANVVSQGRDSIEQRPEQAYQTAYNDFINRKFDLAIVEFNEFLKSFPDAELADNAQYWIGECYYAQLKYEAAKPEFEKVIRNYPNGDKAIPARLKLGLSCYESGDTKNARSTLEELVNRFPFSEEAKIAEDRLRSISKNK